MQKFSARVSPVKQEDPFFRAGCRVKSVLIETHSQVKAGEVLAELEMGTLERDLAAARLSFYAFFSFQRRFIELGVLRAWTNGEMPGALKRLTLTPFPFPS